MEGLSSSEKRCFCGVEGTIIFLMKDYKAHKFKKKKRIRT